MKLTVNTTTEKKITATRLFRISRNYSGTVFHVAYYPTLEEISIFLGIPEDFTVISIDDKDIMSHFETLKKEGGDK